MKRQSEQPWCAVPERRDTDPEIEQNNKKGKLKECQGDAQVYGVRKSFCCSETQKWTKIFRAAHGLLWGFLKCKEPRAEVTQPINFRSDSRGRVLLVKGLGLRNRLCHMLHYGTVLVTNKYFQKKIYYFFLIMGGICKLSFKSRRLGLIWNAFSQISISH